MQDIFEPGFASHRIKLQNKTQSHLNNLSTNKIEGKLVMGNIRTLYIAFLNIVDGVSLYFWLFSRKPH